MRRYINYIHVILALFLALLSFFFLIPLFIRGYPSALVILIIIPACGGHWLFSLIDSNVYLELSLWFIYTFIGWYVPILYCIQPDPPLTWKEKIIMGILFCLIWFPGTYFAARIGSPC